MIVVLAGIIAMSIMSACTDRSTSSEVLEVYSSESEKVQLQEKKDSSPKELSYPSPDYDTTRWVEIIDNGLYSLDIRYATKDNFMEQVIYDCPRCFVDPTTAEMLQAASLEFNTKGYNVVLYDCYRPRPFQQVLWDIMPDAAYVTPPWKGSMHNRGSAVDISLANLDGTPVDMGTEYDYFGKEAHYAYSHLDSTIIAHRKLLRSTMEKHGFQGIRTEWWHFSNKQSPAELSDWLWECE